MASPLRCAVFGHRRRSDIQHDMQGARMVTWCRRRGCDFRTVAPL
jgi:hypothetical protein